MEYNLVNVLAVAVFGLLIVVSGGIIYLTAVDWRDKRRLQNEQRLDKPAQRRR